MEKTKNKGGRPKKPEAERLVQRSIRLPLEQWKTVDANGGPEWLRVVIPLAPTKAG